MDPDRSSPSKARPALTLVQKMHLKYNIMNYENGQQGIGKPLPHVRRSAHGGTGLKDPGEPLERSRSTDEPARRSFAGAGSGSSASVEDSSGFGDLEVVGPPRWPRATYLTRAPREEHHSSASESTTESRREWRRALQAVGETSDDVSQESGQEEEPTMPQTLARRSKKRGRGSQAWSRDTDYDSADGEFQ